MPYFEVTFDTKAVIQFTGELGGNVDQLPYVMSSVLNDAVFAARAVIVQNTWPKHVIERNKQFISASLRVQKATKENLSAHLYDTLRRGHLLEHQEGATLHQQQHRFAIPNPREITRGAWGVSPSQRAHAIVAATPRKALRITERAIYVAAGGRLHLKYSLRHAVVLKATVPFEEDFKEAVENTMRTTFVDRMAHAMATRRG
jgi:hypothetical protein